MILNVMKIVGQIGMGTVNQDLDITVPWTVSPETAQFVDADEG